MPRLIVSLLGPPRIEVDGRPIEVDTRKATALLAYLAVTGKRASRDILATLLWPEYEAERARAALRRTLSTLNRALGGHWLEIDRASVTLGRENLALDVDEFRRALEEDRLAEAAELYRGDFLAGFGLRDSVDFEDWQFFEADGLRRELAVALERLARACAEQGRLDEAIRHARRLLALDPLQEGAHRLLMELFAWSNQRSSALRQYRECVRILESELSVAPLPETTELYEAIVQNRLAPLRAVDETPARAAAGPLPSRYPLVGRSAELDALLGAWHGIESGGRLAVLEGEAGIGKTRLVDELTARVRDQGGAVIAATCAEGEAGVGYGAVVDLLRSAQEERLRELAPPWLAEVSRLLPELTAATPAAMDGPGAKARLLEGLSQALAMASDLLVVDDAQWADESSLEVLTYLARRLRGRRLLVVLTWRSEEVGPSHSLRRMSKEATRTSPVASIVLTRLSAADVASLAAVAGVEGLAERLFAESHGLPLFVVEYLAALAESGPESWPEPGGVLELLAGRVAAVSEAGRQLLAAGAVVGRSFDVGLVRSVSGRSEEEAVTALEELAGLRLLVEAPDGYDFAHEKLRELVYDETSLARRRLLHRRAAETLVASSRRDPGSRAAVIADHYRLAGDDEQAAEWYLSAGERARSLHANVEALAHFGSALALGHPDSAALHEAIGDLHTLLGAYAAALASYETAAALNGSARLGPLEHKLGNVHHRRGDWELAASHYEVAAAALEDTASCARLEVDRSLNEHRRGRSRQALAHARRALEQAEEAGDEAALAQAHNMLGVLASARGRLGEARTHLERSLALAEGLRDPAARAAALNNLALVARTEGDVEGALTLTREALGLCGALGDRHREAALRNNLADLLHASGSAEEAMQELKQAVAIFAEIGAESGDSEPEIWKLVEW